MAFSFWSCAGTIVVAGPVGWLIADERESAVAATLAVQIALQQGREHLLHGDAKAAVAVLESQLSRINGNPAYLAMLRDAYRARHQGSRLARQEDSVQLYLQRLQILDPSAVIESGTTRPASSPAAPPPAAPAAAPAVPATKADTPAAPRTTPTVRAIREDDDPRTPRTEEAQPAGAGRRGVRQETLQPGQPAVRPGPPGRPLQHGRQPRCWAYCKYRRVVEQINQTPAGSPAWGALEKDIRQTLELAPRLDYGKYLLGEIEQRRGAGGLNASDAGDAPINCQHVERGPDGWARRDDQFPHLPQPVARDGRADRPGGRAHPPGHVSQVVRHRSA